VGFQLFPLHPSRQDLAIYHLAPVRLKALLAPYIYSAGRVYVVVMFSFQLVSRVQTVVAA